MTLGTVTVGMGRAEPVASLCWQMLRPSQHQNERKEDNQCLPEMKNNSSDLLDNLLFPKSRDCQPGIKLCEKQGTRIFPRYPIAFPALSKPFSRCGSGQRFLNSCNHSTDTTPHPTSLPLLMTTSDLIRGRISPLPPLPTNEGHTSRVGLELKDLPGHSAVTMRLEPQTLITWGSVGASLIMKLNTNNTRLYLPFRRKHPYLLLQKCSRQWETPISSCLCDSLQGCCSPRPDVCAGWSFSLAYYTTSYKISILLYIFYFMPLKLFYIV